MRTTEVITMSVEPELAQTIREKIGVGERSKFMRNAIVRALKERDRKRQARRAEPEQSKAA